MSRAAFGKTKPGPRVALLDALRGLALINMTAYHALYDLVYVFWPAVAGAAPLPGWYTGPVGYVWQQAICWTFILVAGASLHHGRGGPRHGLVVLACALVLTGVTLAVNALFPGTGLVIRFGVLHMLGIALLIGGALRPALEKTPWAAGLAVCGALFALLKSLPAGALGFFDKAMVPLPAALYATPFLFPIGLPGPGFASSDYFPLLPWLFLFFAGYFAWARLKRSFPPAARRRGPLAFLGRHSLLVYMAHQPLILCVGFGLAWLAQAL